MNMQGKRLLILGSTRLIATIVAKAKEMGIYTIVTDNRPYEKAPAKQIADEYADIDLSDTESIKLFIQQKHIDGILTGFSDAYMPFYLDICKKTGLPCYGDSRQIEIATDKESFKKACIDSNVPVIPGIAATDLKETQVFCEKNGFPVMLKPADNSGSRGVIQCNGIDELSQSFDYAMSFSLSKKVIVEKYMDCDNIAVSYFASNGEIRLSTTDDRKVYRSEESGSSVSSYSEYPSVYTDRYINEVNESVVNMLRSNGFQNGMVSLQAFVDEKSFYFCEMCFRPSGGEHYSLTKDQHGIDQLALLIEFAVTGDCSSDWKPEAETPYFKDHYAMLRILGIPGKTIVKMEGFEQLEQKCSRVLKCTKALSTGTIIGKAGTTAQVIGSIIYKFSDDEDPYDIANMLLNQLTIEDDSGESIAWISLS